MKSHCTKAYQLAWRRCSPENAFWFGEQLLEKYECDDMEVVRFMKEGVRLVWTHDSPPCYPEKGKAASLTKLELENSAVWRRKAIVGKRREASDPAHNRHLEETALEELDMGFVEGPFLF